MPYVATSFVPRGETSLAAGNSIPAHIEEEDITQATTVVQTEDEGTEEIPKTPSAIDRSIEPPLGPDPQVTIPAIWTASLSNGLEIYGIEQKELPIVTFNLVITGGFKADDIAKVGVANMMTDIMMEGTATKTPEELEEEIDLLGASISMYTGDEEIVITGSTLTRNFAKTMDIVQEILLEPRWDEEQFGLEKNTERQLPDAKRKQPDLHCVEGIRQADLRCRPYFRPFSLHRFH